MKTFDWLWPLVIIASTCAINAMVFADVSTPLRPALAIWFISICPGMALVRLLRLSDGWSEMALGTALSLTLGVIVVTTLLYAGWWSHKTGLVILSIVSVTGAIIQLYAVFTGRSGVGSLDAQTEGFTQ